MLARTTRPLLVIISGAPATGKTTFAARLAPALGLPLLAKDDVKETLGDALPPKSVDDSRALGAATFRLLFHLVPQLLESGTSLVLEGNFRWGDEQPLLPAVERARAILLHFYARQDVCLRRNRERGERGERHPVHFDGDRIALSDPALSPEVWDVYAKTARPRHPDPHLGYDGSVRRRSQPNPGFH